MPSYTKPTSPVPPSKLAGIPKFFTGRHTEVDTLVNFIMKENADIIAVTGGPGIGKSSVAIVTGHRLSVNAQVIEISLVGIEWMDTFLARVIQHIDMKVTGLSQKDTVLNWASSLSTKCILLLNDADRLTLNDSTIRQEFINFLDELIDHPKSPDGHVHIIVTTQYRFIGPGKFEQIHLPPLNSSESLSMLQNVTKGLVIDPVKQRLILEKTSGIPLAILIIGKLIKYPPVALDDVIEKLNSSDPIANISKHTKSTFSRQEQLDNCINVSISFLSLAQQRCFYVASRFHGSFDDKAKWGIIERLVEDEGCVNELVLRSLLELAERYHMHSLLRSFAETYMKNVKVTLKTFFGIYSHHYISLFHESNETTKSEIIRNEFHNIVYLLVMYQQLDAFPIEEEDLIDFYLSIVAELKHSPIDLYLEPILKFLHKVYKEDVAFKDNCKFLGLSNKVAETLILLGRCQQAENVLQLAKGCTMGFIEKAMIDKWVGEGTLNNYSSSENFKNIFLHQLASKCYLTDENSRTSFDNLKLYLSGYSIESFADCSLRIGLQKHLYSQFMHEFSTFLKLNGALEECKHVYLSGKEESDIEADFLNQALSEDYLTKSLLEIPYSNYFFYLSTIPGQKLKVSNKTQYDIFIGHLITLKVAQTCFELGFHDCAVKWWSKMASSNESSQCDQSHALQRVAHYKLSMYYLRENQHDFVQSHVKKFLEISHSKFFGSVPAYEYDPLYELNVPHKMEVQLFSCLLRHGYLTYMKKITLVLYAEMYNITVEHIKGLFPNMESRSSGVVTAGGLFQGLMHSESDSINVLLNLADWISTQLKLPKYKAMIYLELILALLQVVPRIILLLCIVFAHCLAIYSVVLKTNSFLFKSFVFLGIFMYLYWTPLLLFLLIRSGSTCHL